MLWLAWKRDVKVRSLRDTGDDCDNEMAAILEDGYHEYDNDPGYNNDIDNDSGF